jgi:hypothetical protein
MPLVHIDADTALSFAAVGLWHKLHHAYGNTFHAVDILTVHPDPNAWGPWDEQHDVEMPMTELQAQGYVLVEGESMVHLYSEVHHGPN